MKVLPFFILFFLLLYIAATLITWWEKRKKRHGPKILLTLRGNMDLPWLLADFHRLLAFSAPEADWWVLQPEDKTLQKVLYLGERQWGYHILEKFSNDFDIVLPLTNGKTSQILQGELLMALEKWTWEKNQRPAGNIVQARE